MTATKERPIIFSGPMVKAILEGRKTQTRRVVKNADDFLETDDDGKFVFMHAPNCPSYCDYACAAEGEVLEGHVGWTPWGSHPERRARLWVREAWQCYHPVTNQHIEVAIRPGVCVTGFKATEADRVRQYGGKEETLWRSPIHMPRWASRLTLEIKSVRVERLQDIGKDGRKAHDVLAEGITREQIDKWEKFTHPDDAPAVAFGEAWNKINGRKHPWSSNPFCWVLEFRRINNAR